MDICLLMISINILIHPYSQYYRSMLWNSQAGIVQIMSFRYHTMCYSFSVSDCTVLQYNAMLISVSVTAQWFAWKCIHSGCVLLCNLCHDTSFPVFLWQQLQLGLPTSTPHPSQRTHQDNGTCRHVHCESFPHWSSIVGLLTIWVLDFQPKYSIQPSHWLNSPKYGSYFAYLYSTHTHCTPTLHTYHTKMLFTWPPYTVFSIRPCMKWAWNTTLTFQMLTSICFHGNGTCCTHCLRYGLTFHVFMYLATVTLDLYINSYVQFP